MTDIALFGLALATIGVWVPVAAVLLVLRGDVDAEAIPKPMRVIGAVSVVWLSHATAQLARAWRWVRGPVRGERV